VVGEYERAF
jgi:site-specific DNA recombinase